MNDEMDDKSVKRQLIKKYRISANSFRGNYSFLNLEIQRSQYIGVRKLFKGGNYSRVETIRGNMVLFFIN